MKAILYVALGGMLGSVGRFLTSELMRRWAPKSAVPLGTLAVNVIGCFVIGWLLLGRKSIGEDMRLFLVVGVLGGFTTFSAFGYETLGLFQEDKRFAAFANIAANMVLGLGAVWLGSRCTN